MHDVAFPTAQPYKLQASSDCRCSLTSISLPNPYIHHLSFDSNPTQDAIVTSKMLPDPALTLSLPSIHDGTIIDCRIYYPASLLSSPRAPPWRRHAAVFAHPYAPMGGCYDDPLLDVAASQLLRSGYLVGTFNFR